MGILRLFLSISVIAAHSGTFVFSSHWIDGGYAVNLFFIISGFYMALILSGKYKAINPIFFYENRVLRLLPLYCIGLFLAVIVSYDDIYSFFQSLTFHSKIFFITQNMFVFGQDLSYILCGKDLSGQCAGSVPLTINPPAWSLSVELIFYIIAPFFVKTAKKTLLLFFVSILYFISLRFVSFPLHNIKYFLNSDSYMFNHYFYPSSFLFFSFRLVLWHITIRKEIFL